MNMLLQLIRGRRVAIVGNAPVAANHSLEIDAADVVIRFNDFYRIGEGKTGRRIDIVLQTFSRCWLESRKNKRAAELTAAGHPPIFLVKQEHNYNTVVHRFLGKDQPVYNIVRFFKPWEKFTTGGAALCYLASVRDQLPDTTFKVYGFGSDEDWKRYIATDAKHYEVVADDEREAVAVAIKALEANASESAAGDKFEMPRRIVIPIKLTSAGLPGKNRILLPRLIEKLKDRMAMVDVVGDDYDMLNYAAKFGARVFGLPTINTLVNVNDTLRQWRAMSGFCGRVILLQATSPDLQVQWIDDVIERENMPLVATAYAVTRKYTALYRNSEGVYVQAVRDCGDPSAPRQTLPSAVMLNGAIFSFHTDALDFPSFYKAGVLTPVIVEEQDSRDVDVAEDMEERT